MGVKLMVEVLDHAPDDATPAERLLLVALAEKADDQTRRVIWARGENPRDVLQRRLGTSDSGLRKVMARLAARGCDPRVPLAIDRHGRPVYAHEGAAAEYVVPVLRADLLGNPLDEESRPSGVGSGHEEASLWSQSGDPLGSALESERRPSGAGHVPLVPDESLNAREDVESVPAEHRVAVIELIAAHGHEISEAEAADCAAWVAMHRKPRRGTTWAANDLAAYVRKFPVEDVRRRAAEHRDVESHHSDIKSRCPHGVHNGTEILGLGANASRRCDRCEQADPAENATTAEERAS